MESNKLAAILEASLKKENLLEPQIPEAPQAPKGSPKKNFFQFSDSGQAPVLAPVKSADTPKFSASGKPSEKIAETSPEKNSGFFVPTSKITQKVQMAAEDKEPNILLEDEFDIDGMGEVWEYAGHSANVNNREDSENDSDEFDPNAVVKIVKKPEPKAEAKLEQIKEVEIAQKKGKRVNLQTRKLMAEAKIQQAEMKAPVPAVEIKKEEQTVVVNVSNEWDNISVRELEEVKLEKADQGYYNRSISVNEVLQTIELIEVEIRQSPKKSFFRGLFSCFRVKTRSRTVLSAQKQRVQKFAQQSFSKDNNMHVSMLKKIYKTLKGADNCPLVGDHWKELGFHSKSPENDLHQVGVYGLFCMFYFTEKLSLFSTKIYKQSLNPVNCFPFAAVCFSFAEVSLDALEKNVLLKEIEKAEVVYEVLFSYFCGLMIYWAEYFTENRLSAVDIIKSKETVAIFGAKHVGHILSRTKV